MASSPRRTAFEIAGRPGFGSRMLSSAKNFPGGLPSAADAMRDGETYASASRGPDLADTRGGLQGDVVHVPTTGGAGNAAPVIFRRSRRRRSATRPAGCGRRPPTSARRRSSPPPGTAFEERPGMPRALRPLSCATIATVPPRSNLSVACDATLQPRAFVRSR